MAIKWHPVAAVTASRLLRAQLCIVEQHAGWDFEYTDSIPHARKFAHRRPMIIIGADLVARARKPPSRGGAVVVATVDFTDRRMFAHAERIGAAYIIGLPQACPWLVGPAAAVASLVLDGCTPPAGTLPAVDRGRAMSRPAGPPGVGDVHRLCVFDLWLNCGHIATVTIDLPRSADRPRGRRLTSRFRLSAQRTAQTSPARVESQRPRASWRQRPHTVHHHIHAVLAGGGAFPCCTGPASTSRLRASPASLG